jgi:hypothetical protein
MRDTAALAAQSDPARNRNFCGRWVEPSQKRRNRRGQPAASSGGSKNIASHHDSDGTASGQRAVEVAARRAAQLDRRAGLYRDLGLVDASLRAAALADELRAVLA